MNMLAEITVPTNPNEALDVAHRAAQYGDRVLFLIALSIIIVSGGWVIRRLFAKLDAKEAQVEAVTSKMITVLENNNIVLEDIKELMEKIKAKAGALVLASVIPLCLTACSTNFAGGDKRWKWIPPQSVVQAERTYAAGTNGNPVLIKEVVYFVQPGTNAPTKYAVRNRGATVADGNNALTKVRTSVTDKTVSAGVDGLDQESKGDVIPNTVEKIGEAVPKVLKGASGIP